MANSLDERERTWTDTGADGRTREKMLRISEIIISLEKPLHSPLALEPVVALTYLYSTRLYPMNPIKGSVPLPRFFIPRSSDFVPKIVQPHILAAPHAIASLRYSA